MRVIFISLIVSLFFSCNDQPDEPILKRVPLSWDGHLFMSFSMFDSIEYLVSDSNVVDDFDPIIEDGILIGFKAQVSKDSLTYADLQAYYNDYFNTNEADSLWSYYDSLNGDKSFELYLWRKDNSSVVLESNVITYY